MLTSATDKTISDVLREAGIYRTSKMSNKRVILPESGLV